MRVLLISDVNGLGVSGEICEVKDGYAKNFLISKGLAKQATNEVINKYNSELRKKAENEALEKVKIEQVISRLSEITLVFKKNTGVGGHLFGSLTKEEISNEIESQLKINIDKKMIDSPIIKTCGEFSVNIKFGYGLSGVVNIKVVPSN